MELLYLFKPDQAKLVDSAIRRMKYKQKRYIKQGMELRIRGQKEPVAKGKFIVALFKPTKKFPMNVLQMEKQAKASDTFEILHEEFLKNLSEMGIKFDEKFELETF